MFFLKDFLKKRRKEFELQKAIKLYNKQRYVEAAELCAKNDVKDGSYYYQAGRQENRNGNPAEANRWFELAIKMDPYHCRPELYRDLASNYATGLGTEADHAKAAGLFEKAVELFINSNDWAHEARAAECCLLAAEQEDLLNHHEAAEKLRKTAARLKKKWAVSKSKTKLVDMD